MNRGSHIPAGSTAFRRTVAAVALLVCVSSARAATANSGAAEAASHGGASVEIGYGAIAEDTFLDVRLKLGYQLPVPQLGCKSTDGDTPCQTSLRLAAQAPLRLRVDDAAPTQDSVLRKADWDEPSDYLRIVRLVQYGHPGEALYGEIGELGPISLGHGSIVRDYYNVIDVDHFQLGAAAQLNTVYGGFEMLLDNVVAPSVVGGRVFVTPWAFVDKDSFLSRVSIGATVVSDVDAPRRLDSSGAGGFAVDDTYNPVVSEARATSLVGADVEVTLLDSEHVGVVPYADFVHHTSLGSGLFAGTFVTVRPTDDLELLSQLEYRRIGADFLPDYVGPLYEIERFQFNGWGQKLPAPKVRVAASLDKPVANGFYGSLTGRMRGLFSVTAAWADHEGPANKTLHLKASTTPVETVQLGVFYHKENFDQFSDAFDLDGALVAAESRVRLYGPVFAMGSYGRMWHIAQDGRYESVDDWGVGLGASMGF